MSTSGDTIPPGCPATILVVDDEPSVLDITKETLETFGYEVLTAENGREALELYERKKDTINLVFVDSMMPEMNGQETILGLQRLNPSVKIVAVSGAVDLELKRSPRVVAALIKPYNIAELLHTVRTALGGTAA